MKDFNEKFKQLNSKMEKIDFTQEVSLSMLYKKISESKKIQASIILFIFLVLILIAFLFGKFVSGIIALLEIALYIISI